MVTNEIVSEYKYKNEEGRELVAMALLNSGICAFEISQNTQSLIQTINKSLKVLITVKALFRRGLAYVSIRLYKLAANDFR